MSLASVAQAKNNLPNLIQQAELGEVVHITRRGHPVAVLLSEREFARLQAPQTGFADFLQEWRRDMQAQGAGFADGGEFENVRDNSSRQVEGIGRVHTNFTAALPE